MTENSMPDPRSPLTEAQQLRFEQDVPQWLSGQLSPEDAAWMEAMLRSYPVLDEQLQWQKDVRDLIREEAAQENTDDAWAMLAQRIAQDARDAESVKDVKTQPHRAAPAWLRWLLGHPGWANACAVAVLAVVLGQAAWIVGGASDPAPHTQWRALDMESLEPARPVQAIHLRIALEPDSMARDLAEVAQALADTRCSWQPQPDGTWSVTLQLQPQQLEPLLQALRALPAVARVELQSSSR